MKKIIAFLLTIFFTNQLSCMFKGMSSTKPTYNKQKEEDDFDFQIIKSNNDKKNKKTKVQISHSEPIFTPTLSALNEQRLSSDKWIKLYWKLAARFIVLHHQSVTAVTELLKLQDQYDLFKKNSENEINLKNEIAIKISQLKNEKSIKELTERNQALEKIIEDQSLKLAPKKSRSIFSCCFKRETD